MEDVELREDLLGLTSNIVAAYVSHNTLQADKLPEFIASVHATLSNAALNGVEEPKVELIPAVSIKKSVTPDYIICLEDGRKFKSLKRHLHAHYNLTPNEYRQKWGLAHDYPMVAPLYAEARSNLAKTMGLGQRRDPANTPVAKKGKAARA